MRALAENVFLDCMTKESDIISYVIASHRTGLYFDLKSYSLQSVWKTRHSQALNWMESMWKKTASLTKWLETTIDQVKYTNFQCYDFYPIFSQ